MNPCWRALSLAFGLALGLGVSVPALAQIKIGQPSGFTGPVASGVKENTDGAKLYIDAVNAAGGVNGQKIELISVDDKFDPKLTAEMGRKLITEQGVIALFLNRGTPHSQALFPVLKEFKVPLVGPSTGAMVLHHTADAWQIDRAFYDELRRDLTDDELLDLGMVAMFFHGWQRLIDAFGIVPDRWREGDALPFGPLARDEN